MNVESILKAIGCIQDRICTETSRYPDSQKANVERSTLEVCRAIQKVLFHVEMDVPDHGDLLFCRSNYIRNVFEWSHSEKCGLKDDLLSHNGTIWYGFAINFSF